MINLLSLESQNGIGHQIGDVKTFAFGNDFGMFAAQQPSNVREEEASVNGIALLRIECFVDLQMTSIEQ